MPFRMFSLAQVAEYLHVSEADVERLVKEDAIPYGRRGDRLVFAKGEIDAWASRRLLEFPAKKLAAFHQKTSAKHHDLSRGHSIVSELAREEFIAPALTCKTKAALLRQMVRLAEQGGLVCLPVDLLRSLEGRERLCSTALPGGIALLHPQRHEPYMFADSFIALGKAIQPIPFGSPDGAVTDLFFLICCQDDRLHLHVLARLCMMCQQTSMVLEIREASDAATICRRLAAAENEVIRML